MSKDAYIRVRMSKSEKVQLERLAKLFDVGMSEIIRNWIVQKAAQANTSAFVVVRVQLTNAQIIFPGSEGKTRKCVDITWDEKDKSGIIVYYDDGAKRWIPAHNISYVETRPPEKQGAAK